MSSSSHDRDKRNEKRTPSRKDEDARNDQGAEEFRALSPIPAGPGVLPAPAARDYVSGEAMDFYPSPESTPPQRSVYSLGRLWRYRWSMLIIFLAIAALGIPAVWLMLKPTYTVMAEIRVRPIIPRLVFQTDETGPIPFYQSFLNTQVSVLRSPTVVQRVLDQPEVQRTEWFHEVTESGSRPTDRLLSGLLAYPRPKTEIIDVAFDTRHPQDGARILNTVLDQYILYSREMSDETRDVLFRKLIEEAGNLENEIQGQEARAAVLRRELGSNVPDDLVSQRRVRLDELQAQLASTRRRTVLLEWQAGEIAKLIEPPAQDLANGTGPAGGDPAEPPSIAHRDDPEWRRLDLELRNARYQLGVESGQLGRAHPRLVELQHRIEFLTELRGERQEQIEEQWAQAPGMAGGAMLTGTNPTVSTLPMRLQDTRAQLALLAKERELLEEDVNRELEGWLRTFDSAETLARMNDQIMRKREVFDAVRTRMEEKRMERNVPGAIEVLSRAVAPAKPSRDRRVLFTAMVAMVALGAAVGQALLRSGSNQTIYEAEDITPHWNLPMLGQIPLLPGMDRARLDEDPVLNECIRMIRTTLLQRAQGAKGISVLITSADPGTGKTTVSLMLARSLARCGKRVLLVDADVRTASLSTHLGLKDEPGLLSVLASRGNSQAHVIRFEAHPGEYAFLPAGQFDRDTQMEMIANGTFRGHLDQWRDAYDIVLLDSPPVLATADAQILSQQADGTVMVVREGHSRRSEVFGAMAQLSAAGDRFWGTVFIGSHSSRPSYRYSYGYGYGYGQK